LVSWLIVRMTLTKTEKKELNDCDSCGSCLKDVYV